MATNSTSRLAAEFARVLARYGNSIHNLHRRTRISRETLTKLSDGAPAALEAVERFARAIDEDVNHWRELAGYPPLGDSPSPAEALLAGLRALDTEFGQPVMFSTEEVRGEPLTHARVAQILAAIREKLESRRGSTPPPAGGTPRKRPNGPGGGQQLAAAW